MRRLILLASVFAILPATLQAAPSGRLNLGIQVLPGNLPQIENKVEGVDYQFDLASERVYLWAPKPHTGAVPYGLFVYVTTADDIRAIPPEFESALLAMKLIFVAPQRIGAGETMARKIGFTTVVALKMREIVKVDTNRIYVAGFSGAVPLAAQIAFTHPDVFKGMIGICGAAYIRKVDIVKASRQEDNVIFEINPKSAKDAKSSVKFVFVTGTKDFRYGNIFDMFQGYVKDGHKAKLIEVPNMAHTMCPAKTLEEALKYLEDRRPDK